MKKLRIAQVVSLQESVPPRGKNGLEFMVHYLTEELVKRGHEVTLFATKDSKTSARLVPVVSYPASRKYIYGWNSTNYSIAGMVKACEMKEEFDIIHSHIGNTAYYFADLADVPMVETIHSPMPGCKKTKKKRAAVDVYWQDAARRFDKVHHVFVSHSQKNNSKLKKNASVVHNGIDLERFSFKNDPRDYFIYLGYITEDKGAHLAARAARKANVKLKLAGSCSGCKDYFKEKVKPCLKKGKIEYVGAVNPQERNRLLGGAKGILVPLQWEEPFGLVMIEAMACGTPVIGLDRAAVPEIVKNGKTGFVVKDEKGMAQAIKNIEKISRAECRRHVEKYFTVQKMADEYEKVYEKVINNFTK
ncbi:MAG: glycosyltransferase family 4 protein [Candidatus Paceibacterota bacterium]|jgi:glycosyltransferase involved in cell wall biosynthesis